VYNKMAYGKRKRSRSFSGNARRAKRAAVRITRSKLSTVTRRRNTKRLGTHSFSRYGAAQTVELTGTEQPLSFEFTLADIYSYSEFTTLFDKYKLTRAVVMIQMINNPNSTWPPNTSGGVNNNTNFYPKMWYITDHDDSATTTIAAIKERVGVKCCVMKPNVIKKISVKPACAVQIYRTATTTGYGPRFNQYIDMTATNVPHYGLKCVFDPLGLDPGQTFSFRYEWKLYFTCKDVQ